MDPRQEAYAAQRREHTEHVRKQIAQRVAEASLIIEAAGFDPRDPKSATEYRRLHEAQNPGEPARVASGASDVGLNAARADPGAAGATAPSV
jgi:hypothetical protein